MSHFLSESLVGRHCEVSSLLHAEVAAMNLDNFVIRPKRRLVKILEGAALRGAA